MLWTVWHSSSLHLHRQRSGQNWFHTSCSGRNVPRLHHFIASPLSSLCPRQTQPVQHRNLTPHTAGALSPFVQAVSFHKLKGHFYCGLC